MNEYSVYTRGPRKGQTKTLTDAVVKFVTEELHWVEMPCKSRYRQFSSSARNDNKYYFIGKNGSVRVGTSGSKSISVTHKINEIMNLHGGYND